MGVFFPQLLSATEVSQIVDRKLNWILEACLPQAVVVFGSAARQEMSEQSDVDLAILFPSEVSLREGRAAIFKRPPPDSWALDLLFFTAEGFAKKSATGGVCQLIRSEGRVLFGAMP